MEKEERTVKKRDYVKPEAEVVEFETESVMVLESDVNGQSFDDLLNGLGS